MSDEPESFELGLNNLIQRAYRAEAEAQRELRYLNKLDQFLEISKELREAFRKEVTRQTHQEYVGHEDDASIAPRFAPNIPPPPLPSERFVEDVFGQMNGAGRVQ